MEMICSKNHPYNKKVPMKPDERWVHPDAKEIAEDYGKGGGVADGDYVQYHCPHCDLKFWVELPN